MTPRVYGWLGLAVVLGTLAGCGGRGTGTPSADADAGGDGGSVGGTAPPSTYSAVTGRRHEICHQLPADADMAIDLSTALVQALVPDAGHAGYRVLTGSGDRDGRFTIAGVPDGVTFYLRIENTYYATDHHTIEVVSERSRRCMPAPAVTNDAMPSPQLSYDFTHVTEVAPGGVNAFDRLAIVSLSLGYASYGVGLQTGDTSATGVTSWVGNYVPVPLLDAALGDDLRVFHVRSAPFVDPASHRQRYATRLLDALDASGVTLTQGGVVPVAGELAPAPTRTLSLSIDVEPLDRDAGLDATRGFLNVQLFASPVGVTTNGATLLDLDLSDRSHSDGTVQAVADLPYGDPFPASWKRTIHIDYSSSRSRGALAFDAAPVHNEQLIELSGAIDMSAALHPPASASVEGLDFARGGKVDFDGEAPVMMRWDPAPGATVYRLSILDMEFALTPGQGPNPIATFWTTDTMLRLPASVFAVGEFPGYYVSQPGYYVFVLDAVQSPIDLAAGRALGETERNVLAFQPIRLPAPIRIAGRASARFHLVAHCGDGRIQPAEGERCDTRGESATCNADCTLAVCGDGVVNTAAGEECDSAGASMGCNANCTRSRCGDGHFVFGPEDCDDGNALDDGNGCSTTCKFNNQCGNGVIEDAAEECDPGPAHETATCDADCTRPICGDRVVNAAAGEECDEPSSPHCFECKRI